MVVCAFLVFVVVVLFSSAAQFSKKIQNNCHKKDNFCRWRKVQWIFFRERKLSSLWAYSFIDFKFQMNLHILAGRRFHWWIRIGVARQKFATLWSHIQRRNSLNKWSCGRHHIWRMHVCKATNPGHLQRFGFRYCWRSGTVNQNAIDSCVQSCEAANLQSLVKFFFTVLPLQITAISWDHANSEVKLDIKKGCTFFSPFPWHAGLTITTLHFFSTHHFLKIGHSPPFSASEDDSFLILTMANSIELEAEFKLRLAGTTHCFVSHRNTCAISPPTHTVILNIIKRIVAHLLFDWTTQAPHDLLRWCTWACSRGPRSPSPSNASGRISPIFQEESFHLWRRCGAAESPTLSLPHHRNFLFSHLVNAIPIPASTLSADTTQQHWRE